jgi:hypothetical protein
VRLRALDSIRGLLLLQMTLDHFGKPISSYLFQCFGFFSAAEGFFFLSGFVGMFAAISKREKDPSASWMRTRAFRIWKYHIISLASLVCSSILFLPALVPYFRGILQHPHTGSFLSALLIHTPTWLDVLPLYVILMLIGSFFFPRLAGGSVYKIWLLSFLVWILAQFGIRENIHALFPKWINHGFFDLLGWQFIYFSGAAIAAWWKHHQKAKTTPLRFVQSISYVAIFITIFLFLWSHQWISIPLPSEFWISREHLGPLRYLNFIAFALSICFIVRTRPSLLDFQFSATLGKHSLEVYTAHTILIYIWLIVPKYVHLHMPWNIIFPLFACFLLWLLAFILDVQKQKHKIL